tara:strand:- start:661 stop:837 length:177 start_codon:yes stop_codon:yes gene_type:complete
MSIIKYRCPYLSNNFRTTSFLRGEREVDVLVEFSEDIINFLVNDRDHYVDALARNCLD